MKPSIVALCGRSRSGKSTLARHLVEKTGGYLINFGDFVRAEFARSVPGVMPSRRALQDFGQGLVSSDPRGFLQRVMAGRADPIRRVVILDGLRHVGLLKVIREQYPDSEVRVIFVEAGFQERKLRSYPITAEEMSRGDSHEVEEDAPRLRAEADLIVATDLGQTQSFEVLDSWAQSAGIVDS